MRGAVRRGHSVFTPPSRPRVIPTHNLAHRLTRAWIPAAEPGAGTLRNIAPAEPVGIRLDSTGNPPLWGTATAGAGLVFDGVGNGIRQTGAKAGLFNGTTGSAFSVAIHGRVNANTDGTIYQQIDSADSNSVWGVARTSTTMGIFIYPYFPSGFGVDTTGVPSGSDFVYAATWDGTNVDSIVRDLTLQTENRATGSGSISGWLSRGLDTEAIGHYYDPGGDSGWAPVTIHAVYFWLRQLSELEMRSLLRDPYQFLEPDRAQSNLFTVPTSATASGTTLQVTATLPVNSTAWGFSDVNMGFSNGAYGFAGQAAQIAYASYNANGATLPITVALLPGGIAQSGTAAGVTLSISTALLPQQQPGYFTLPVGVSLLVGGPVATSSTQGTALPQIRALLLPGGAAGSNTGGSVTLSTTLTLTPASPAAFSSYNAAGVTLPVFSLLIPGLATGTGVPRPPVFIGGGGAGPGGDPELPARLRKTISEAVEKALDPEGWAKKQAKAREVAEQAAAVERMERELPDKVAADVLKYLGLSE